MNQEIAGKFTREYLKPIYGFALKRCANLEDAEDLTQDIALKVFRTLLVRDDIEDVGKFLWIIAHHALANYYRSKHKIGVGVPLDEMAELLSADEDLSSDLAEKETVFELHREIAYLSKLQRRIVIAFYYENKKQDQIAKESGIPVGTVKWHLFEAKKDLKKGLCTMRSLNELKFNPIRFEMCGSNGSIGTKGPCGNFFRSSLAQNIEYAVWKDGKTVNEIADLLGVSPVYVEDEAAYLEEYGFLTRKGDQYLCNILLEEGESQLIFLHDKMYQKAAELFANELFDELINSDLLRDETCVECPRTDDPTDSQPASLRNRNFILWSLIPFIAAFSGEQGMNGSISFDEACTIRPDGGQNICYALVENPDTKRPLYFDDMKNWFGPCWNSNSDCMLWLIDSKWSEKRIDDQYHNIVGRIMGLLSGFLTGARLSPDDYAFLAEKGILRMLHENESALQIVRIKSVEAKNALIAIGDRIKEKHKSQFDALKQPYIKAVLDSTPKHLHKMQQYSLQSIFYADGWFLLHCMQELVNSQKLQLPTEEQRKSLTTLIVPV